MRNLLLSSALVAASALSAHAQSASPYSADDVANFLVDSADLGLNRGICIGTAEECAPPKPKGMDMMINFELDSAELTEQAKETLAVVAQAFEDERLKKARFMIEGHTDARGTEGYNGNLSEDRAAAVQAYLVSLGVTEERLSAMGFGETAPRTDDPMDPENRRVELRIDLQ
ncbi:OmpA family protein [Vannielia litorea]|uniref:Outer membrane protein OmpA n=1 Tax=Vannielia litorea TaxID=1217970 RepID=A0A1N6G0R3_9RHOB|nr:OmpA family protein [Vannielia litorea]SIO01145.1 Outer membrane protein OmpA [Vannielia litorea]